MLSSVKSDKVNEVSGLAGADESPSVSLELGVEFCIELVLVFYQLGRELMGLPVNVPLGAGCWAIAMLVAIRILWILPITSKVPRWAKALFGIAILAIAANLSWHTVLEAYRKQNSGEELTPDTKVLLGALSGVQKGVDALKQIGTQPPTEPAKPEIFRVSTASLFVNLRQTLSERDSDWWILNAPIHGVTLSPIPVLVWVTITNKEDIPESIASYEVALRTTCGWIYLHPMYLNSADKILYTGIDFSRGMLIDFSGNNLYNILRKPIEPNHTVRGWLFFYSLEQCRTLEGDPIQLKFTLHTDSGKSPEFLLPEHRLRYSDKPTGPSTTGVVHGAEYIVPPQQPMDLRSIPRNIYGAPGG